MEKVKLNTEFSLYNSKEDLPEVVLTLMQQAILARDTAYSPYSQFQVGAALLMENQEVFCGSNQENAAFPAGLCAERTALFYAAAKYPGVKILKLAISAKSLKHVLDTPTAPCGICRQAIAEYEVKQKKPIELYFMGETGKVLKSESIADLLPLLFDNSCL